jgi:single-strand DNA-binding protein
MKDLNMVFLMGNLTRDPELRYTPNGQAVTTMTIATNRTWNDQNSGEKKESAEFTDVVVWGKMAENVANYLKKGRRVHVIGRLQTRNWEAQDGSKKYKTEVIATDVTFLDKADGGASANYDGVDVAPEEEGAKKTGKKKEDKPEEEINIEDIPF